MPPQPNSAQIISFDSLNERPLNVLIVEDSTTERIYLETQLNTLGHLYQSVKNGKEAVDIISANPTRFDMVLMDRMMPVMDGLKAVKFIKNTLGLRDLPIIMITAADSPEELQDGLAAGIFYYLSKPVQPTTFNAVISAVSREVSQRRILDIQMRRHRTSFAQIHTCKFEFNTLEQAESIAGFIAQCFPQPERVITGLAELMINAVEHGLYEIGYDLKSQLLNNGTWRTEIDRRQSSPQYAGRMAHATVTHQDNGIYVHISDNGHGFEWEQYLTIDPARSGDNHGRGIAQANALCFDKLIYNDIGNSVSAFVYTHPQNQT